MRREIAQKDRLLCSMSKCERDTGTDDDERGVFRRSEGLKTSIIETWLENANIDGHTIVNWTLSRSQIREEKPNQAVLECFVSRAKRVERYYSRG